MRAPQNGSRYVLIVEDNALVALELEEIVRHLGHLVAGPVSRVEPALHLIEASQIDAALLDVQLESNQTSYPIASELERKRIPFMFVTGVDKGGLLGLFPDAQVVQKPFQAAAIQSAVQKMLGL
jgi:CheY-like chemotaxis protein